MKSKSEANLVLKHFSNKFHSQKQNIILLRKNRKRNGELHQENGTEFSRNSLTAVEIQSIV